ncbi:MAG: hypothetical protein ACRDTC_11995 [Pseudonocardiaceae bacterium]
MSGPLDRLRGALLVQCRPDEVDDVRRFASGRPGAGVLVTTPDIESARHSVGSAGGPEAMVLDASRYAGARRLSALNASWSAIG